LGKQTISEQSVERDTSITEILVLNTTEMAFHSQSSVWGTGKLLVDSGAQMHPVTSKKFFVPGSLKRLPYPSVIHGATGAVKLEYFDDLRINVKSTSSQRLQVETLTGHLCSSCSGNLISVAQLVRLSTSAHFDGNGAVIFLGEQIAAGGSVGGPGSDTGGLFYLDL
jgi:hypothetical protein